MATRTAEAEWQDTIQNGNGTIALGSGAFKGSYSFGSRFRDEPGTNPEELIAAAHAGCFSMALALGLGQAGFTPRRTHTKAAVHSNGSAKASGSPGSSSIPRPRCWASTWRNSANKRRRPSATVRCRGRFTGTAITLQARLAAA